MGSGRDEVATLADAMGALRSNVHYLRAIALMAQQRDVVVVQTVLAEDGSPLLEKGRVLDATGVERLAGHRLMAPLDAQLAVSDPVDIPLLLSDMTRLLSEHPLGRMLAEELGADGVLLGEALEHMTWPPQARFLMTVVHSQLPTLFEHSLLVALVAVFLAVRAGWNRAQCAQVVAAGLLHDVGMLYMSTAWTDTAYKLSDQERAHLAAHSITGSMVLKAMRAYPVEVEDAVLEHQECMDGSGYPRQLAGAAISPMGRMLMVAEVVTAFFGKYTAVAGERLSLMLRLHRSRYPVEQVAPVLAMLQRAAAPVSPVARSVLLADCHTAATVLQYWASCLRVLPAQWQGQPGGRATMLVHARVRALEMSLAEAGAHVRPHSEWVQWLDHDPQSTQELGLIYREAMWQLESCIDTCLRRWPQLAQGEALVERALSTWLLSSRKALAQGAAVTAMDTAPGAIPRLALSAAAMPTAPLLTTETSPP